MSWDIFVQELPENARSISEIHDDFRPGIIGERGRIIEAILRVVPEADFSEPSWGLIEREGFSIEVNLGQDEQVSSFAFHVRGGGKAVELIDALLNSLGMRAIDSSTGDIFSIDAATRSFREWQAYRDGVSSAGNSGSQ